jgi:hypothetical protein
LKVNKPAPVIKTTSIDIKERMTEPTHPHACTMALCTKSYRYPKELKLHEKAMHYELPAGFLRLPLTEKYNSAIIAKLQMFCPYQEKTFLYHNDDLFMVINRRF